jgi:hypothetical protein
MMEGMNLIKIHCKHICKYHNESPLQLIYANKRLKTKPKKLKMTTKKECEEAGLECGSSSRAPV